MFVKMKKTGRDSNVENERDTNEKHTPEFIYQVMLEASNNVMRH